MLVQIVWTTFGISSDQTNILFILTDELLIFSDVEI